MNYILTDSFCPVCKSVKLNEYPEIVSACSTRLGGVSKGIHTSMNLGFLNGDDPEDVHENFRIICNELQINPRSLVFAAQTHTNKVRVTGLSDHGKGIFRERDYDNIDALVTNNPGTTLIILTADCVPVSIYDPVNKAIGLAHSGWRGTATEIVCETIKTMQQEYGSKPENLIISTGPSICKKCYEVSADVVKEFEKAYNENEMKVICEPVFEEHYLLDLNEAIKISALRAGVKPENFEITGLCTNCNPELLFSHRATHGKRGTLATFLCMKPVLQ